MDVATPIGIVLAIAAVIVSYIMEGGSPAVFMAPPAILLVVVGTLGVALASNRMSDMGGIVKAAIGALLPSSGKTGGATAVTELMQYAEIARKDGLLALEEKVKTINDPFLRRGLELVIDGTDSSEVADALEEEIDAQRERHKVAAKFFGDMGAFAPTLGIIGTVLGLVHALEGLSEPEEARARHQRRLPGHALGRHHRQRAVAAAGEQAQAHVDARGEPPPAAHPGHPGHPGRLQPARRRRAAQEPPPAEGAHRHGGGSAEDKISA